MNTNCFIMRKDLCFPITIVHRHYQQLTGEENVKILFHDGIFWIKVLSNVNYKGQVYLILTDKGKEQQLFKVPNISGKKN